MLHLTVVSVLSALTVKRREISTSAVMGVVGRLEVLRFLRRVLAYLIAPEY